MSKKNIFVVVIVTAIFISYNAYNLSNKAELSDVLLSNVEALADGSESSDDKVYPKYINVTDKNRYKEFRTEIKKDSTSKEISIQYSRTCTTYYTHCKYTGKEGAECYGSLNGMVTDCTCWTKD